MTDTRFQFAATAASDDVLDAITAKIAKLLRQARDRGATEQEREAFEAKALSLMAKHRIDAARLHTEDDDEIVDTEVGEWRSRYGLLVTGIGDAVARAYSCQLWWKSQGLRYLVYVTGHRSDADRVRRLIATLVPQALTEAAELRGANTRLTLDVRRSYLIGFAAGVVARFADAAAMANADDVDERGAEAAASTALVFVGRAQRVQEVMATKRLRAVRAQGGGNLDAHQAGYGSGYESGRRPGVAPGSRALTP